MTQEGSALLDLIYNKASLDASIENLFLLDEHFFEKRETVSRVYGVCVPDDTEFKGCLFKYIDQCNDKIIHITPKPLFITMFGGEYQVYVYVKQEYAFTYFSSYKVPKEEMIHSIKLRDYFSVERFLKTGVIYCKTDYLYNSFMQWLQHSIEKIPKRQIVLITGSADFCIDDSLVRLYKRYVADWFGTNVTSQSEHVYGIPLGLTSYDPRSSSPSFLFQYGDNSDYHRILADDSCILNAHTLPKTNTIPIYMNFSKGTYHDRPRIWNEFKNHYLVCAKEHACTLEDRYRFFEDMRQSEYSLCPRGNGIDTHRFWESLYSGVIPIIEKNRVYEFFKGLPFIEIPSMNKEHLTEGFLKGEKLKWELYGFNYQKLYVSYWIEQIERKSVQLMEK
jgi:hypothetical protein